MWVGAVNCFQCGNPIIHEEDIILAFGDEIAVLPSSSVTAVDADTLFKLCIRVAEGREACGSRANIMYRVKLPSKAVMPNSWTTGRRSYRKQGERLDRRVIFGHRRNVTDGIYAERPIESAIDKTEPGDRNWRNELFNAIRTSPRSDIEKRLLLLRF